MGDLMWVNGTVQLVIRYTTVIGDAVGMIVLLLVMNAEWGRMNSQPQRARYIALLFFSMSWTFGGVEALAQNIPFSWRHVVAFISTIAFLCAVGLTVADVRRRRKYHGGRHSKGE